MPERKVPIGRIASRPLLSDWLHCFTFKDKRHIGTSGILWVGGGEGVGVFFDKLLEGRCGWDGNGDAGRKFWMLAVDCMHQDRYVDVNGSGSGEGCWCRHPGALDT